MAEELPIEIYTAPTRIDFSRNPIEFTTNTSVPGREIRMVLRAESSHYAGDWTDIITSQKPSLSDGSCTFRLDGILNAWLERTPEIPEISNAPASKLCQHGILNYRIRFSEIDPADDTPLEWQDSGVRCVIRGALPEEVRRSADYFGSYMLANKKFLTWSPASKTVSIDHPEFLYFLNTYWELEQIKVQRTFYTSTDTTVELETINFFDSQTRKYRLIQIPALKNIPADATRMELALLDENNEPISETRYFKIDQDQYDPVRYFLFENSLGGYDTLRCTGETEITIDGKDELAEQENTDPQIGQYQVYSQDMDRKIKQSTGFHFRELHRSLQDFLYARRRFIAEQPLDEDQRLRLVPIILKKRSYSFKPEKLQPNGFTFEYDYAFDPIAYANF